MKAISLRSETSGQLWWVVVLLAITVILPTVCLLWFISQAVRNERLAVRQKLVNIYQQKLSDATEQTDHQYLQRLERLEEKITGPDTYTIFNTLIIDEGYDGLIIYEREGERIFPFLSAQIQEPVDLDREFSQAIGLEFGEKNFAVAGEIYEQKAQSENNYVRLAALIGKSRCLARLGKIDEAIASCRQVALADVEVINNSATLALVGNGCLLMLEFLGQGTEENEGLYKEALSRLVSIVYAGNEAGVMLTSDKNLFFAYAILETLKKKPFLETPTKELSSRIQRLALAEERSISIAERFAETAESAKWKAKTPQRFGLDEDVAYGFYHKVKKTVYLLLISQENISSLLGGFGSSFADSDVVCRVVDESGRFVAGIKQASGEAFITAPAGENFSNWRVELYFAGGDVFERFASRQIALYTWAGVLVIVLILAAGGFAARAVGRQIKLNKLKNDFIATVSHELKTPLASMRVLVDTLLEGNYEDQKQVSEYLQLTSKENERLSRLIDNFLTFSRMERGKQSFDFSPVSPVVVAEEAAEVAGTKFDKQVCRFDVSINENLPNISADKDAIVTVLVNLLDNAYKYTGDDKQISLKVFAEADSVCFRVTDNGTGMSKRAVKKVFSRFYQVDRTLSRQAGGTGLGLSIVKFIVDAHKGEIDVDSKPGKGSTFTVKIPAAAKQD